MPGFQGPQVTEQRADWVTRRCALLVLGMPAVCLGPAPCSRLQWAETLEPFLCRVLTRLMALRLRQNFCMTTAAATLRAAAAERAACRLPSSVRLLWAYIRLTTSGMWPVMGASMHDPAPASALHADPCSLSPEPLSEGSWRALQSLPDSRFGAAGPWNRQRSDPKPQTLRR